MLEVEQPIYISVKYLKYGIYYAFNCLNVAMYKSIQNIMIEYSLPIESSVLVVNSTQDELAIGTIIGGAVAGLVVAILATLIAVWTILFVRRRQMTTAHISREPQPEVSTRKRALTRPIYGDRELASDATSIRNEDNIKVSHNASYITNTAAIPISQNEAYGTLQTDDSREHGFDSKKHPSVYYDYVDSKTGRH